jgi:hypothetical protein
VDTPGEKKPRVKEPPAEMGVSPSVRFWPFSSLSAEKVWIHRNFSIKFKVYEFYSCFRCK